VRSVPALTDRGDTITLSSKGGNGKRSTRRSTSFVNFFASGENCGGWHRRGPAEHGHGHRGDRLESPEALPVVGQCYAARSRGTRWAEDSSSALPHNVGCDELVKLPPSR
jgi:hypothetical protein